MKIIPLILILMIALTACTSPNPTEQLPTDEAYPYPYPAPVTEPRPVYDAYPEPEGEAIEITWEEAEALILDGVVTQVAQTHKLQVTLITKDGRKLVTQEPEIDAVFDVVERCGELCSDMILNTE